LARKGIYVFRYRASSTFSKKAEIFSIFAMPVVLSGACACGIPFAHKSGKQKRPQLWSPFLLPVSLGPGSALPFCEGGEQLGL